MKLPLLRSSEVQLNSFVDWVFSFFVAGSCVNIRLIPYSQSVSGGLTSSNLSAPCHLHKDMVYYNIMHTCQDMVYYIMHTCQHNPTTSCEANWAGLIGDSALSASNLFKNPGLAGHMIMKEGDLWAVMGSRDISLILKMTVNLNYLLFHLFNDSVHSNRIANS